MSLIRSISGVRGTIGAAHGAGLTPLVATRHAAAFAAGCREGPIVLGRDGRPSGVWVVRSVAAALAALGREVIDIGTAPTPSVQLAVEYHAAAGGIAITASHNPEEWSGLKFIGADGTFLGSAANEDLFRRADQDVFDWAASGDEGRIRADPDALARHIESAVRLAGSTLHSIQDLRLRVVVDAVNASGSYVVPSLLERLGCTVVRLFCDGSGRFPHRPEPIPENLFALRDAVTREKASLGIAVDPDADRLVLVDERGAPFGEENTIVAAVRQALRGAAPGATVVTNLSTTSAVGDVARAAGARLLRTPVGEINVVEAMRASGAAIGGEGSGGVIHPAMHLGRDSLAGIVLVLGCLAAERSTLSGLHALLPSYVMRKERIATPSVEAASGIVRRAREGFAGATIRDDDGIRAEFPDGAWVQVRRSNTEPIVRIIVEAADTARAEELLTLVRRAAVE